MQSETGFPSSHQLKSYVAFKSRLKLAARAVLSADAGLLVLLVTKHAYDRRTDKQTDGQNYDSQDRASIAASRGKRY